MQWQHVGLFITTLTSTDALAISSIMKSAGGPEDLNARMKGESIINNAFSLLLFTVFLSAVRALNSGSGSAPSSNTLTQMLPGMTAEILRLSLGGVLVGFVLGWVTLRLLRMLRHAGAAPAPQLGLIQAMGYLTFYLANAPFDVSGVIAIVCYGLYGAATCKFGMERTGSTVDAHDDIDAVQETLAVLFNGITFFLGGATAINFLLRAIPELRPVLLRSFIAVPVVYVILFLVRAIGMYCFNSIPWPTKSERLTHKTLHIMTWSGLRGSISLIMAMVIVADYRKNAEAEEESGGNGDLPRSGDPTQELITAQMVAWNIAIVAITLCVNAPTLPAVMEWCGLLEVPAPKAALVRRARVSLAKRTEEAIEALKHGR